MVHLILLFLKSKIIISFIKFILITFKCLKHYLNLLEVKFIKKMNAFNKIEKAYQVLYIQSFRN